MLHTSPEVFYSMTPIEFYYAVKAASEYQRAYVRELYEIARLQAVLTINPHLGKKGYEKVTDCITFTWEKAVVQSVPDIKQHVLTIGAILGDGQVHRKSLDDPPTHLAIKNKK